MLSWTGSLPLLLDAPLIGAFLDYLENRRKNSARTRNTRLAAIRSLFNTLVAYRDTLRLLLVFAADYLAGERLDRCIGGCQ
jgi:hypothetical protein